MRRQIYKPSRAVCDAFNAQRGNSPIIKLTPDGKLPDFGCQTNQNEIRKGRRRRFASGDRHAFNKHRGNKAGMICTPRA